MGGVGADERFLLGHLSINGIEECGGGQAGDVVVEESGGRIVIGRLNLGPSAACASGLHLSGEDEGCGGVYGGAAVGPEIGGGGIRACAVNDGGRVGESECGYGAAEGGGEVVA